MFIDARSLSLNNEIHSDVCIVGAGAAGITIALQLENPKLSVTSIESGDLAIDSATQDLYNGLNEGRDYSLLSTRLRYFGGSTNHWGGYCRPLDDIDFKLRPWVPLSGWPISRKSLDPWYAMAQDMLDLGPYNYDVRYWKGLAKDERKYLLKNDNVIQNKLFQFSPPTRYSSKYAKKIEHSSNIRCYLNLNVLQCNTSDDGRHVLSLTAATLNGSRCKVKAKIFVLALGGIETTRLLLLSDRIHPIGYANRGGYLGACFMEHPDISPGVLYVRAGVSFYQEIFRREIKLTRKHGQYPNYQDKSVPVAPVSVVAERVQNEQRLLNSGIQLHPLPGTASVDVAEMAISDLLSSTSGQLQRFALGTVSEQAPNKASRLYLSKSTDKLGQPKIALDWRVSEQDKTSIYQSALIFSREVAKSGIGRLKITLPPVSEEWPLIRGYGHHMGSTRMSFSYSNGVVDPNLKVHGLTNCYVASSSVFPTSGSANPTLTLVALCLRLSEEIKKALPKA
ncbi:MAG: GMC family oxidoreductase [Sulfuricella sp.]